MEPEKQTLRNLLRRKGVHGDSPAVLERLRVLSFWKDSSTILLYRSLPDEPDTNPLMKDASGKSFLFPRIDGHHLCLHRWNPGSEWITGPFGLEEPDPNTWESANLEEVDLCLVPGMAFDPAGTRLGRGKGFYDRLLATPSFRAWKIGLSWESRILSELPREAHDVPMDAVITDSRILIPGSGLDIGTERG